MCYLLPEIHRKPHVPNVTLAVIKSPKNSHIRLTRFNFIYIILHFARFPAYNGIFTRLKEKNKRHVLELNYKDKNKTVYHFKIAQRTCFPGLYKLIVYHQDK